MSFSATWDEVAGDKEGVQIAVQSGALDPEWDQMDKDVKMVVQLAASCAEDVIRQLAETKEGKVRYRVNSFGHLPREDAPMGRFELTVSELA